MLQTQQGRISVSFTPHPSPTQSVVLQRRHFHHVLLSDRRKNAKSNGSAEEVHKDYIKSVFKPLRKYRMKDKFGNMTQKHKAQASISITGSPGLNCKVMNGFNQVTLNVCNLKVGTFNRIYSGPVTFSLECIEFANKVQLDVSDVIQCEWCTAHGLPALFLQTTAAFCSHLRTQLSMLTDINTEFNHSQNVEEKHVTFVFENEPTALEKDTLQEIFMEIGKLKNMNNFLGKLTVEEATDKLMAVEQTVKMNVGGLETHFILMAFYTNVLAHLPQSKNMQDFKNSSADLLSEMATVSDSKSDDEWMECTPYQTQPAEILVVYPPPPAKGGFSITEEDLACLNEGEFLNDVIIDFYLKYLVCEKLQKEAADRCHVFSSFFFKSLTYEELTDLPGTTELSIKERRHNRVKTWTRHLDLFEKDFIFVPINQSSHWYLAVICYPGKVSERFIADHCVDLNKESSEFTPSSTLPNPMSLFYRSTSSDHLFSVDDVEDKAQYKDGTKRVLDRLHSKQSCILIMDSLSCRSKPGVVQVLQEYLEMEWFVRKGSMQNFGRRAMKGWSLQVPQQDNYTDCGLFLLQYVESFITNPPQFHQETDLSGWFPLKLVKKKRERIKRLIYKLHNQQHVEAVD